jgi:hypothetical protein
MASIRTRKNLKGETTYTVQVRVKGFPNEVASRYENPVRVIMCIALKPKIYNLKLGILVVLE